MLVWSEAWNAEGEKGETDCSFKHMPPKACVPPTFHSSCPNVRKWNKHKDFDRKVASQQLLGPRPNGHLILSNFIGAALGLEPVNAGSPGAVG
jgi:hypothetical protein